MNKKVNIKTFITIAFIIMLFSIHTISLAGENYSATMTLTSNSKLKDGEIVKINVNLSNIVAGNGIDVLTAELNYDTNVFEPINTTKFNSSTNWTTTYAPSTNMVVALKNQKVTKNETIFTIELKVKSVANINSTTITLRDITVSGGRIVDGGTGDISVKDASISISKAKETLVENNYSAEVVLNSNSKLKEGEIVTINANLKNIVAGNGVDTLTAGLIYDTNIFEPISTTKFNSTTNWVVTYAPSTNRLVASKNKKVTQNETIFTIQLKVKSVANINSTTITLQNITVSGGRIVDGGTEDISVKNASITLNKIQEIITASNNQSVEQQVEKTNKMEIVGKEENSEKAEILDENSEIDIIEEVAATDINTDINKNTNNKNTNNKNTIKSDIDQNNVSSNMGAKEYVAIATVSSATIASIGYMLFRKLKFII